MRARPSPVPAHPARATPLRRRPRRASLTSARRRIAARQRQRPPLTRTPLGRSQRRTRRRQPWLSRPRPTARHGVTTYQPARRALPRRARPQTPPSPLDWQKQRIASRRADPSGRRYQQHIPPSVWTVLIATARGRLLGEEPLYRDVASHTGIRWELLAACDWMQSKARPGYSPVQGEKLGTLNPDGTRYHTKSESLEQCAQDLAELAGSVYQIDLTAPGELSVCDLASAFAAFRWGGLLKLHHTSAMEFPYSVAGLTIQHTSMRWPKIDEPNAPDKPGSRFRMPFGAVPVVLSLNYPPTI